MKRITGPLGIWPFPLLNFLLEVVRAFRGQEGTKLSNIERWEAYRDEKGRLIVEVHREVEGNG